MSQPIDAYRVRELLDYDPETGKLTWRLGGKGTGGKGSIAGYMWRSNRGGPYQLIKLDGKNFRAHRLAWIYVHGRWPAAEIDHIDGNGLNNKISNLREATRSENNHNRCVMSNNRSGLKGAIWDGCKKKWRAIITINGRRKFLGAFDTAAEAHAVYIAAAKEHHGDFYYHQSL